MEYTYQKYKLQLLKESSIHSQWEHRVTAPSDLQQFFIDVCHMHENAQEIFLVVSVNAKGKIIGYSEICRGDLTSAQAHPREVMKFAILCNSASIILAHNHPSEDPSPSPQDIEATKRLIEAGEILGIPVLDHVIVGSEENYVSLREQGYCGWN